MSLQMEKMMQAMGQAMPQQKRILELNAEHPVIKKLISLAKNKDEKVTDMLKILYDQSMILEGTIPDNPSEFVKRIDDLMSLIPGE